jgi:hypothetical protein
VTEATDTVSVFEYPGYYSIGGNYYTVTNKRKLTKAAAYVSVGVGTQVVRFVVFGGPATNPLQRLADVAVSATGDSWVTSPSLNIVLEPEKQYFVGVSVGNGQLANDYSHDLLGFVSFGRVIGSGTFGIADATVASALPAQGDRFAQRLYTTRSQ